MTQMVFQVALPVPLYHYFDYLPPSDWQPDRLLQKGIRVYVPFGRRQLVGILVEVKALAQTPQYALKHVIEILDEAPLLPSSLLKLLEWLSRYYHSPLGEVILSALPASLRRRPSKKKSIQVNAFVSKAGLSHPEHKPIILTEEQKVAVSVLSQSLKQGFHVFLLEGVTGSGKTEVYFQMIQNVLVDKKQVLLLVPEISLTPQMVSRLQQRFQVDIGVFHSGRSKAKRYCDWEKARTGQLNIVVGTRSALFIPFSALGLIIVDEEHDSSFRQQDRLGYHARDVAIVRAQIENIPIILGSATPSLESIWNARRGRYQRLTLTQRAGSALLPKIEVIDIRGQSLVAGLSDKLIFQIKEHIERKEQVLLFLNRRGFSPLYLCHGCGWMMVCHQCDSPLRFHRRPSVLKCHHCGFMEPIPKRCPQCSQEQLFALGQGTQKLEEILEAYFPELERIRIDADSSRGRDRLSSLLEKVHQGQPAILIGTQMLAKGHHFPHVTLVAIIEGDSGLFGTDFRSLEHAAQLITQVAGRAGRANKPGQVVIQTYHPKHPMLKQLIERGYSGFSELALIERERAGWPPFSSLVLLRAEARIQTLPFKFLEQVKIDVSSYLPKEIILLGPIPALLARRSGYYRAQLLFQTKQRSLLHQVLNRLVTRLESMSISGVRWSLDIDPNEVN